MNDPEEMQKFFFEIFTPAEIDDFILRWRLMEMLYKGTPQRCIAAELGISLCKITRGSKILKEDNSITVSVLKERIDNADDKSGNGGPFT